MRAYVEEVVDEEEAVEELDLPLSQENIKKKTYLEVYDDRLVHEHKLCSLLWNREIDWVTGTKRKVF